MMSGLQPDRTGKTEWAPPTDEEIRERAYQLHLSRQQDRALEDWLEAEAELFLRSGTIG